MTEYRDPTAKEIRDFLEVREGNVNGIYHDSVASNVPTHGLGINFDKKNSTFIRAYIGALNDAQGGNLFNPDKLVNHYVFSNGSWIVENGVQKTLVEEIMWLSSPEQTKNKPFESQIIDSTLHLYTNSAANEYAFDTVVYRAFLGKSGISYGFNGIKDMFYDNVWEKLDLDARISLYSTFYNGRWNNNIRDAIKLYTNDGTEYTGGILSDKQVVGKLSAWMQILYFSNTSNNKGIQNRCFYDANRFLGKDIDKSSSVINVSNIKEANITIAFMNLNKTTIFNKLNSISGYSSNPYDYIRDNFSEAIEKIFFYNNYKDSYDLSKLFTEWNVLTDLTINTVDGSTSYGTVTGTDLKDIIFLTSNQDNSKANGGDGDDEIYGNLYNANILYGNGGNDIIKAGIKNDTVDGGYIEDTSEHANKILLGAGSDTYNGGIGKDIVDGGSKESEIYHYTKDGIGFDVSTDINNINLGGGSDKYNGGIGKDIVDGGSREDKNTDINEIDLGFGDDEYRGGIGKDIVNGGSGIDKIYAGDGNNNINGGIGKDIVDGGSKEDTKNDKNRIYRLENNYDGYRIY